MNLDAFGRFMLNRRTVQSSSSHRQTGVAAHEAIKIVTKQFLPISGFFLFNGINGSSLTSSL
jgi:hypothetical protein